MGALYPFSLRQKLAKHKPETLGQAARISGITPASISLLLIHLKKGGFKGFAISGWYGLMAPAGTPRPVIEKIARDVARVLEA